MIAKLSSSVHKNCSKNGRCGSVRCLISEYDEKHLGWVQCNSCDKWIHLTCKVTRDRDIEQIDRTASHNACNVRDLVFKKFSHILNTK